MANPQQPELARSRKTPHQDQDSVAGVVEGQRHPGADAPGGPVPAENQPGHHPPQEQDKPDLDAFAERLGIVEPEDGSDDSAREPVTASAPGIPSRGVVALAVAAAVVLIGLVLLKRRRRR